MLGQKVKGHTVKNSTTYLRR